MDIDWYGRSCFRIREGGMTIVTDPYDKSSGYSLPRLRADLVTVSHNSPEHAAVSAVKNEGKTLARPGEYEIGGVFITGVQTWRGNDSKGEAKEENTVFVFEFGDLTVCHLGDLAKVLTQAQVEALPAVDVLFVPVGGGGALDADDAAEVISLLEPRIVVPMNYRTAIGDDALDPLERFLKEMGVSEMMPQDSLKVTRNQVPEETEIIILQCKQA